MLIVKELNNKNIYKSIEVNLKEISKKNAI
jgi:hypothetical protein